METDPEKLNRRYAKSLERAHAVAASDQPVRNFDELLCVKRLEEELCHDIRDNDERPEDYWAAGWTVQISRIQRTNFLKHQGRYVKSFPARYRLRDFHLNRSFRRVLAKNNDLRYVIRPLRITPAKESLHAAYNFYRFNKLPEKPLADLFDCVIFTPTRFMEICFFEGDNLIAFGIFELGVKAALASLNVWSPSAEERSLGILTILKEVEYAKSLCCHHYYVGPYHIHNPIFAYKTRFPGLELYDWDNERWIDYHDSYVPEMLRQELPRTED
jgi:arginyl-tRNA--protein-N-Asp/Glu arginylyltransferase